MKQSEKRKRDSSPFVKGKKKPGPKKANKDSIDEAKKSQLAASDKGSWYNQPQPTPQPSTSNETGKEIGASRLKIHSSKQENIEEEDSSATQSDSEVEFKDADSPNTLAVVDRSKINNALQHFASCSYCGQKGLILNETSRNGLGAEWAFTCQDPKCSSHNFSSSFRTSTKGSHAYDVNRGLVLGLRLIGRGHSAAERLLSVLNLPRPITKTPWASHTKVLEKAARELLDKELSNAAKESMEAEGACILYGRSVEKHKLRYIPFVGDGDSKSYSSVCKSTPYGPCVTIPKEDCIGHVTKRMGTALRKVKDDYGGKKLADGKGIGGQGRLTNTRIDALQNFYGKAIRDNKGDAAAMSKATHAILKHYSSTPENPRHEDCPQGVGSWCSYNRDLATGETTHQPIKDPLPQAIVDVVQPTFDRLGDERFLVGSENCLDQNNNESLHHVIWGMAPKEQFTSQQEASLAVSLGVLVFNNGMGRTLSELLPMVNMEVEPAMRLGWERIDNKRISTSEYKSQPVVKKRRKKRRREKSKKQDGFVHKEGVMYSSQNFY